MNVSAKTNQINNINITDINGNSKNFALKNNIVNDNLQNRVIPDNRSLSQILLLNNGIGNNLNGILTG
jgi:hypothetical protein